VDINGMLFGPKISPKVPEINSSFQRLCIVFKFQNCWAISSTS